MNETDFASYADDNTSYITGDNIDSIINSLENYSIKLLKWFAGNQMKANKVKRHLISTSENNTINEDGNILEKSN